MTAAWVRPSGSGKRFHSLAPVKITSAWEENGQERKDARGARAAEEARTIRCGAKPLMESMLLGRAD